MKFSIKTILIQTLLLAVPSISKAATVIDRSGTLTTAYTVRDHLGSMRAVVGRDGTVLECDEYYPFGTRHDLGRNYPTVSSLRLKYNGKEQQDIASLSLPYLDYGARLYNPAILRWNAQDPKQEKNSYICNSITRKEWKTVWNCSNCRGC